MLFIVGDIWRTDTLVCCANAAILGNLSLHIPIPLIDLVLLQAEALLQLYNLGFGP